MKDIFELTEKDIKQEEVQKRLFRVMLNILENEGKCRAQFHLLGVELFQDDEF